MSAMPQIPKLTISTPMTTAMTALPSQFEEAFRIPRSMGPTCLAGGNRHSRRDGLSPQAGVTELMAHHKVAALGSQPRQGGELKRYRACDARSGTGPDALLALARRTTGIRPCRTPSGR